MRSLICSERLLWLIPTACFFGSDWGASCARPRSALSPTTCTSLVLSLFSSPASVKILRRGERQNIEVAQYNLTRPRRSSRCRLERHLVPTGCKGGGLTSCPWSTESGSGSIDSTSAAASRCFSSSNSIFFCRSIVKFTPTFSGGIGAPTAPQPSNPPIVKPTTMDVALSIRMFMKASARVL